MAIIHVDTHEDTVRLSHLIYTVIIKRNVKKSPAVAHSLIKGQGGSEGAAKYNALT